MRVHDSAVIPPLSIVFFSVQEMYIRNRHVSLEDCSTKNWKLWPRVNCLWSNVIQVHIPNHLVSFYGVSSYCFQAVLDLAHNRTNSIYTSTSSAQPFLDHSIKVFNLLDLTMNLFQIS